MPPLNTAQLLTKELLQINADLLESLGKRIDLDGNYTLELASATSKRGRGVSSQAGCGRLFVI